jgi:hypothetical protein
LDCVDIAFIVWEKGTFKLLEIRGYWSDFTFSYQFSIWKFEVLSILVHGMGNKRRGGTMVLILLYKIERIHFT